MYITDLEFETYTGLDAPSNFDRLQLLAVNYFKSIYPNFPSESEFDAMEVIAKDCVAKAISEQILLGDLYTGTDSNVDSFSVGSYSQSGGGSTKGMARLSSAAKMFLDNCGVSYKGVQQCRYPLGL